MSKAATSSCCLLLVLALVQPIWPQSGNQGTIQGIARDRSGAAVAEATITARNLNTSAVASTHTDRIGLFRFPVLAVGTYILSAEHHGFAKATVRNVALTVGASLNLSIAMQVAGPSSSVEVTDEAPIIETTRSQLSSTVESPLVSSLPVNGRDYLAFVLLTPGVTQDVRGGLSFGGQRAMNSLLLDGIGNDDTWWGQAVGATGFSADGRQPYHISQDAVQEFQVNSNAYSAEFGRAGGGVINTVTKSGTNDFHGSAFWFYRDKSLNATDPVNALHGLPKDPFHFNQFGGTLGGPLRKHNVFFFVSYEGMRSNIPNAVFLNLPGGFHLSADQVVASFQQTALDYLSARAASWVRPIKQNDYFAKLDWRLSNSHQLSGLWLRQAFSGGGAVDPQNSFEHTSADRENTDFATVSLTSAISDRAVNVARSGYLATYEGFAAVSNNPEANVFEGGQLLLAVGTVPSATQMTKIHQAEWSDTVDYARGKHAFKIGADVLISRTTFLYALGFGGSYTFGSLESFGRSLRGVPMPRPDDIYQQSFSGVQTPGAYTHPNVTAVAGFGQDEFRMRPNLTLNLGLRYDLELRSRPPVRNPSPELVSAGLDTSALPLDWNNIAPRLGVAWSPVANNRLVVRAGYGIFYALTPSALAGRAFLQNDVTVQTRTFFGDSQSAPFIPAYPKNFCGPPDPSGKPPSCAAPSTGVAGLPTLQMFSHGYVQPYVHQGSVGVQAQLQKNLSLLISYVGTHGANLQQIRDINLEGRLLPRTIGIANTNAALSYLAYPSSRPLQDFHRLLLFESSGESSYHGLIVQVNRRLAEHFQFLSSYTFSKVADNKPNVYALGTRPGVEGLVSYPTNPQMDRSLGDNDQRHRFALGAVWDIGYQSGLSRAVSLFVSGWQVSGILTAQSGTPYSGLIRYDLNNDGDFATDRTPGVSRNSFNFPTSVSLDPRLTRTFSLGRTKLQFIGEAFNVLNHANVIAVNDLQYSVSPLPSVCGIAAAPCLVPNYQHAGAFGEPTASSGPRLVQLALRVIF